MKIKYLILGVLLAVLVPMLVDWLMFGTIQPCHNVSPQTYVCSER